MAHSYADRVPLIADKIRELGGSATVAQLFEHLATGPDGLFATPRRIAATVRWDMRQDLPIFERDGETIRLSGEQPRHDRASEEEGDIQTPFPSGDRNPFEVLGIASDVEPEVIVAAYRALAHKYHPDVNHTLTDNEALERMSELNWAKEELERNLNSWRQRAQHGRKPTDSNRNRPKPTSRPESTARSGSSKRTESIDRGWWSRLRDKLLGRGPTPSFEARFEVAFKRSFMKAMEERFPGMSRQATSGLLDFFDAMSSSITGGVDAEYAQIVWPRPVEDNAEDFDDDDKVALFGMATVLLLTTLEVFVSAKTVCVVIESVILDEDQRVVQGACLLSVETTRENAESFGWDPSDDEKVLEHFDLRFSDGKPVVPHTSNGPDEDSSGSNSF